MLKIKIYGILPQTSYIPALQYILANAKAAFSPSFQLQSPNFRDPDKIDN